MPRRFPRRLGGWVLPSARGKCYNIRREEKRKEHKMTSCGWLWLYAGVGLMLAELLAPGFVVFFFGLSAASVVCF